MKFYLQKAHKATTHTTHSEKKKKTYFIIKSVKILLKNITHKNAA